MPRDIWGCVRTLRMIGFKVFEGIYAYRDIRGYVGTLKVMRMNRIVI